MKRTALVTGGNSGIGFETAKKLRQRGYSVYISGRDHGRVEEAAAELGVGKTQRQRYQCFLDHQPARRPRVRNICSNQRGNRSLNPESCTGARATQCSDQRGVSRRHRYSDILENGNRARGTEGHGRWFVDKDPSTAIRPPRRGCRRDRQSARFELRHRLGMGGRRGSRRIALSEQQGSATPTVDT